MVKSKEEEKNKGAVDGDSPSIPGAETPTTDNPSTAKPTQAPPKPATNPPKKPKEEMVEVSKSVLEEILQKQEGMEGEITNLKKDNKKLTAVADKSRLVWYDEQHGGGGLIHTFKVGIYTDYKDTDKDGNAKKKIVLGWKLIRDDVHFVNGILKEDQIFKLYIDEGEGKDPQEKNVNIFEFSRELDRREGELIKEAKTSEGITKTLRFEDGREIEFDVKFLNP